MDDIRAGRKRLYLFAYVDYIDNSTPPSFRQTACVRVLDPFAREAQSFMDGSFIIAPITSEYEYQD
jgi:hypothetical protein